MLDGSCTRSDHLAVCAYFGASTVQWTSGCRQTSAGLFCRKLRHEIMKRYRQTRSQIKYFSSDNITGHLLTLVVLLVRIAGLQARQKPALFGSDSYDSSP